MGSKRVKPYSRDELVSRRRTLMGFCAIKKIGVGLHLTILMSFLDGIDALKASLACICLYCSYAKVVVG